jgi:hypothetical protein
VGGCGTRMLAVSRPLFRSGVASLNRLGRLAMVHQDGQDELREAGRLVLLSLHGRKCSFAVPVAGVSQT